MNKYEFYKEIKRLSKGYINHKAKQSKIIIEKTSLISPKKNKKKNKKQMKKCKN